MFDIRYAVVFKKDGLDDEGTRKLLSKYGTIFDVLDETLEDEMPIKLYFIDGTLRDFTKIKLDLNCVSAEDNLYLLIPMLNLEEKLKVLRERI